MRDRDLVEPRCRQRQIERGGDVVRTHRGAELLGDDEAGEVIEHRREIIPAPARDLQVHELADRGLPPLTTILVKKGERHPAEDAMTYIRGVLGAIDIEAAQQEVFAFDWTSVSDYEQDEQLGALWDAVKAVMIRPTYRGRRQGGDAT